MRSFLLALALLSGHSAAQEWREPDLEAQRERLARYIELGWSSDDILAGLRRWFGRDFQIYPGERDVFLVQRRADGQIYYWQLIGTLPEQK